MSNGTANGGPSRVGPLDTIIILLIAASLTIFLVWLAGQVGSIQTIVQLPDFIVKGYGAIWTVLTGAGASTVLAVLRGKDEQRPNYLIYSMGTMVGFLVLVFGTAFAVSALHPKPTPVVQSDDWPWPDHTAALKVWVSPRQIGNGGVSFQQHYPREHDPVPLEPTGDDSVPPNKLYQEYEEWPGAKDVAEVTILPVNKNLQLASEDQLQKPLNICFASNPNRPTNSPPFEVRMRCSDDGKCSFAPDDFQWAVRAQCPASTTNDLAASKPLFSLTPTVFAANSGGASNTTGWSAPALDSLLKLPANTRPGFTQFELKSESLAGLEKADSFRYEIFANGRPIFVNGWAPSDMVKTFNPAQGFDFSFALEDLDFSGAQKGCEQLQINLDFMSNHQVVKTLQLTRLYAALRDAVPEEFQPAAGVKFIWSGTYKRPAVDDKVEVFVISPGSADEAVQRKQQIDNEHLTYAGMNVVGVVRPPLNAPPSYGVIVGLREPSGQIKFVYDYDTAQKIKAWAIQAQVMKGIVPFLYETRAGDSGAGNMGSCGK